MPSNQEASPATLEEHLLHPVNLKAAGVLKAGGIITAPNEITLKVRWSPNQAKYIHEQLNSWLTTGCVFRPIPATDSDASRPPIPTEPGH